MECTAIPGFRDFDLLVDDRARRKAKIIAALVFKFFKLRPPGHAQRKPFRQIPVYDRGFMALRPEGVGGPIRGQGVIAHPETFACERPLASYGQWGAALIVVGVCRQ